MKIRRLTFIALMAVVISLFISVIGYAENIIEGNCGSSSVTYKLTSGYELVIGGNGVMPDYNSGQTSPWAEYSDSITAITIGSKITSIGKDAFVNISVNVMIPNTVSAIGEHAFGYKLVDGEYVKIDGFRITGEEDSEAERYAVNNGFTFITLTPSDIYEKLNDKLSYTLTPDGILTISGNGPIPDYSEEDPAPWSQYAKDVKNFRIKKIIVEEGVTHIGNYSFIDCESITEFVAPSTIKAIGDAAFKNCSALKTVTLKSGITTIGESAFEGCASLTNISLSSTITKIGDRAFYGCSSIQQIILPDAIKEFGAYSFAYCSKISSFVINDAIKTIPDGMFYNCTSLSSVSVGSSVYTIGDYAFVGCTSLRSITLSYTVKNIGQYAIGYEYKNSEYSLITKFTTEIQSYTPSVAKKYAQDNGLIFDNYRNVDTDSGDLTDEITWRFRPSTGVLNIIGDGEMPDYTSFESTPWAIYKDYIKQVTFSNGITNIGSYVFEGCFGLTHVDIPGSVQIIGEYAFAGTSIITLTVPSGVREIANNAFEGCSMLYTVTLPATLSSIGQSAFMGPNSIISITIPQSVTFIGEHALGYASNSNRADEYIIKSNSGTVAESYASANGITFVIVGYQEISDSSSGAIISIPESNYDKLSITFEKIKVGSILKDYVFLSDSYASIIYKINLLNDGKTIKVSGPISFSVPIPTGMENYVLNIYAIVDNKQFIPINYQKVGDKLSFSYDDVGEFVLTNADLTNLYTISVNYKYNDGSTASSTEYYKAISGATYRISAKEISGCNVDNSILSGTVGDKNIPLEFVYTRTSSNTNTDQTTRPVDNKGNKDDSLVPLIIITILLFLTLIAALVLLLYVRSKRDKNAKETERTMAAAAKHQIDSDENARTMVVPDFATRDIDIESLFADDPEEDNDIEKHMRNRKNRDNH